MYEDTKTRKLRFSRAEHRSGTTSIPGEKNGEEKRGT